MARPSNVDRTPGPPGPGVPCRRVVSVKGVAEHRRCPYCFGSDEDVASGDHRRFCDFDPDADAMIFGFPEPHGRHLND